MRPLHVIAREIQIDWRNVHYSAKPYLYAMLGISGGITDMYGFDGAREIVLRFLGNATSWKGETARRIKKELNGMLKGKE